MTEKFNMDGYVDVAERIRDFDKKHPEGSLQAELVYMENPPGWLCVARAYRTPDDPRPGVGHAFEPVPGKTPYTRDSEAMNAETSAWGRAIVALGFETKKVASANEVRNREETPFRAPAPRRETGESASDPQKKKLRAVTGKLMKAGSITQEQLDHAAGGKFDPNTLTKKQASGLIDRLERYEKTIGAAA